MDKTPTATTATTTTTMMMMMREKTSKGEKEYQQEQHEQQHEQHESMTLYGVLLRYYQCCVARSSQAYHQSDIRQWIAYIFYQLTSLHEMVSHDNDDDGQ